MFNTQNAGVNIIDSVGHLPFVPPPEGICGAAAHPSFYILSMAQVESEALTTHSAPPTTLHPLSIFHTRLHLTRTAVAAARVFHA